MGNCYGTTRKKKKSAKSRQDVGSATSAASTGAKRFQLTKGASMYIPEDHTSLTRDNLQESTREIMEFLDENGNDLNNPVYAKLYGDFRIGDPIEYAPEMQENITFGLSTSKAGVDTIKCTFAYQTLGGKTNQLVDKANQDSVAVVRLQGEPHQAIFAVFDGHGPYGEHASHFCRMELAKSIAAAKEKKGVDSSPEVLLEDALTTLHRKFAATNQYTSGVDPFVSGTTAIVVCLDGKHIISANIGDSRAILGNKLKSGEIEAVPLSSDHKPQRPDEKKRIEQTKARLLTEADLRGAPSDSGGGKTYICREKRGDIIYGVLFSRSIGDVDAHKHLGVITDPEFIRSEIDDSKEQCIIVASDGVWDQMTNEEVIKIVFETNNPLEACDRIVKIASQRWTDSEEHRRDDITLVIIGIGDTFAQ